ncbi:hypothetical protein FACS1894166_03740 [Bacilli bacterium]|nr:hypothetical protein FACS1894166_03740 [Bacilli bacterium]
MYMRSKIARKICSMLPLVLLPPTLIVSCAQNSQFDIKIDRNNTKHLSFTNLSVTLTAKIFDKKSQMDMSDEQCCT